MKKFLIIALIIVGCAAVVNDYGADKSVPTLAAPEPVKPIPFNSKPMLMNNGLVICEDGSLWGLVKAGDILLMEQIVPPMVKED